MRFDRVRYLGRSRDVLTKHISGAARAISPALSLKMLIRLDAGRPMRGQEWSVFIRVASPLVEARNVIEDAIARELVAIDDEIGAAVADLKKGRQK